MSVSKKPTKGSKVRLNDVDWQILEVMRDGRRYTQTYLDKDIDALDDVSYDWLRQRVLHLYENGLIEKAGSSSMYEITEYGLAALELRSELETEDVSPVEVGEKIRRHAADRD